MTGAIRIDCYDWAGSSEAMLRFGPDEAPRVILSLPLYEEANRMRAFAVALLRRLAEHRIAGVLPDWPGTGESVIATADATLAAMRQAYTAIADARTFAIGFRSGALIDTTTSVRARWHLSPITGEDLVRELRRTAGEAGLYAGNAIGEAMMAELAAATPAPARVVRLDSDPRPADRKIAGSPLWRRAEPGNDPALAETLAEDIAVWIAACGA